jgi:hypothetical protein
MSLLFDRPVFILMLNREQMECFWERKQRDWPQETGLYIETCFDNRRLLYTTLFLLALVIALGKLAWGSWDVVFGAKSFFVAIPILVLTVISSRDC